ncbi:hypothetical protein N7528_006363 [Penicillium herquei]|nr:hypothetical protein N7528_006363 [Penicillium herquei]
MIAINTLFNGYNALILPMSEHNIMVRNSILAASMSHLSIKHAQWKKDAAKYHMAAIKGLTQQMHGGHLDSALVYSSLSTMILLLIEEMITAQTRDFRILLRMIQSFIKSQGGEIIIEKSPVGKFLIQQIRKMSLYSAPLISESLAIETFQNVTRKDLEFLYGSLETNPTNFPLVLKLAGLIHGAASVYLARACNASDEHVSMLVQHFLAETATFNASSPGGHILIWPFFIVGTECSLDADRQFVIEQLNSLWNATGFGSTLYATELLNSIWQGRYGADVTKFLADQVEGFIM